MRYILYYCLVLWWNIRCTYQQDSADDEDSDDNDDTDICSFIAGQTCDNNGVCRYCAMCLQNSCILNKPMTSNNTIGHSVCNATEIGTSDVYDWYGYCLSSGDDISGDYCETRTQCYQYLRINHTSTPNDVWTTLMCDPYTCVLVTDNGQLPPPAPPPLIYPPTTHHHHNRTHDISSAHEKHNSTVIALSVSCTLIFVGVLVWFIQLWKQSSYWPPSCLKQTSPYSISPPPSFRSTAPEMTGIVATRMNSSRQQQQQRSSSLSSINGSNSRFMDEPLPSYFSPDPSPPKYEHAIVTQIRGLLEDDNYHLGASSSTSTDEYDDYYYHHHDNALPPPMWVPIYFAANRTSFSLGRLRRQPSSGNNINTCQRHDSPSTITTTNEHDLGSSSAISTTSASLIP